MPEVETLTYRQAAELAAALARPGASPSIAETVAELEARSRTAGKLITCLLRGVSTSDLWRLPADGEV